MASLSSVPPSPPLTEQWMALTHSCPGLSQKTTAQTWRTTWYARMLRCAWQCNFPLGGYRGTGSYLNAKQCNLLLWLQISPTDDFLVELVIQDAMCVAVGGKVKSSEVTGLKVDHFVDIIQVTKHWDLTVLWLKAEEVQMNVNVKHRPADYWKIGELDRC